MKDGIEEELLVLAERAVQAALAAGAQQAEACAGGERELKVGFQRGDLGSVSTSRETTLGLRVYVDGRLGFVTTNRGQDLGALAAEAVAIARCSPPDDFNGLPDPQPVPSLAALVSPDLAELGPETLARLGGELAAMVAATRDPRCPGAQVAVDTMDLSVHDSARAVVSSTGVRQAHRSASASGGIFGMAIEDGQPGSFSYDGDAVRSAAELPEALDRSFRRFAGKCLGAMGAGRGESFRGPIIVPAEVLSDLLLDAMLRGLCADTVRQGTSPFAGRLGERIAGPGFSLVEGGAGLAGHPITPFDREGMPRQRRALVQDGVLSAFLYDGYEARCVGGRSSGHAAGGAGSLPKVAPSCLEVGAGHLSLAQLEDVPRAVVVTRFSGSIEGSSGNFSGVVKGGFLISGGERRPVMETTIAGNLWEALRAISGISQERESFYGMRLFPAVRFEDISISAA